MQIEKLIREYLEKTQLMQIATCSNNNPWVATVHFAYDENLNLYWISSFERRHSIELEQNANVAAAIVKPHTSGEKVRGIQLSGQASRLSGNDAAFGMEIYTKRYNTPRERVKNIVEQANEEKHVIYKIKPELFVLFDEVNFPDNPRQEWKLQ